MKTLAVALTVVLGAVSLHSKSINQVSFSVQVKVENSFSPEALNLLAHEVNPRKGDTIMLERHTDYLRALKDKQIVVGTTHNKAWVVAFFMNREITLDEAFSLMNNYNAFDETNSLYKKPGPNDFYYAIEILTTDEQTLDDYLKICPELEKYIMQKDERIFVAGKISSHSKAVLLQEKFVEAGLKNNVVVAYEGTKQVPVYMVARSK
ncbi:MAG TPA: hypothetical protein VD905_10030 [Flavobacteriales bacterium]|nr:hypothetical protein [Flavobacteriales bacterium]